MRPIAIKASNNKELEEQVKMVQENAYRDGVDEAIKLIKIARDIENMKGSGSETIDPLDQLINNLPKLYDGIGIPKEADGAEERLKLYRAEESQMSEREALYREFGAQEDED